jgi:hypothetical protein
MATRHARERESLLEEYRPEHSEGGAGLGDKSALDANGVGVCPTSDSAMKQCGLGALIMAPFQITNDRREAHDLAIKAMRWRHTRQRQRHERPRSCARVIRRSHRSGVSSRAAARLSSSQ